MAGETYKDAGVDIAAGEEAVLRIKEKVRTTFRPEVIGDIGGFGGLFSFASHRYRNPVLVSSTDGVGTKAVVAQATGRFDTIGVDLVAMCVDDLVCAGAEPLFFLDYIAVGQLDPDHIEQLVEGVAEGCRQAGCALIGGEMAEHPGSMDPGEFDLVGFAVGVVERDLMLGPDRVHPGDALIGLPSPGLRSNGYSLARRVLLDRAELPLDGPAFEGARHSLGEELLEPSVIYAPAVRSLLATVDVHALAHITGGGLPGNLPRSLPKGCDAVVDDSHLGGAEDLRGDPAPGRHRRRGDAGRVQHGPGDGRRRRPGGPVQGPGRPAGRRPPGGGDRRGRAGSRRAPLRVTPLPGGPALRWR